MKAKPIVRESGGIVYFIALREGKKVFGSVDSSVFFSSERPGASKGLVLRYQNIEDFIELSGGIIALVSENRNSILLFHEDKGTVAEIELKSWFYLEGI